MASIPIDYCLMSGIAIKISKGGLEPSPASGPFY